MESLGKKLQTAREEKGLSVDYISHETNIAIRYLEALEREDFAVFPGEAYTLGFLKNYGAYLDLDTSELLSLYRSLMIQEQPIPVDELLRNPSPLPKILGIILIILVILALGAGAAWFFINRPFKAPGETTITRTPAEYTMNTDSLERRFYLGDAILIPMGADTYKLQLSALGDTVGLTTPSGLVRLDLSQDASVDLNNDGITELRISVSDFARNDSAAGAVLRFDLAPLPGIEVPQMAYTEGLTPGLQGSTVILSSPNAYPFTMQAVFQGYCLFRWEILFESDKPGRNEQYFQMSDELNVQAQNGIRIGMSNAQAVKLQVIGGGRTFPLEPGGAGEIVVADIRWLRDEDNRYRLVLARLE